MLVQNFCSRLQIRGRELQRNDSPSHTKMPSRIISLRLSTGFSSEIGTKLRDWAVGQAGGCCYSRAALSSNDSKTLYCLRFPPDMIEVRQLDFLHCRVHRHTSHHCRHRSSSFFSGLQPSGTYPGPSSAADRKWYSVKTDRTSRAEIVTNKG